MVAGHLSPVTGSSLEQSWWRILTDMVEWEFELKVSDEAAALVRRKGGTVALDFIPPIS